MRSDGGTRIPYQWIGSSERNFLGAALVSGEGSVKDSCLRSGESGGSSFVGVAMVSSLSGDGFMDDSVNDCPSSSVA